MTERFMILADAFVCKTGEYNAIQDKETDRKWYIRPEDTKTLCNLLNTLDKMNKCHLIRIHAQDEYILKLETKIQEMEK